ncbi:putative E3 ubiquitin-protein ligase [Sesamum angolense]|uniref:E3 ubiquitin-protein ligase n=2 Tax=Sesamum TaxID=4181 RepID=A0AAE1XAZ9_9LAMI|nr:putative E3 ubiquitin-protein ligase [Sesamum angolense]
MSMQKCEEDIKNLENMISELRLESDKSKIAALNVGYGSCLAGENISAFPGMHLPKITKRLAVFQDNFGGDDVKPERECVMCMTDEIAVVFLPCAHQVLCGQCSVLHEKQGMNDCPSCRTTIKKRISVTYRAD